MGDTSVISNVTRATRQELMDGYRALLKKYKEKESEGSNGSDGGEREALPLAAVGQYTGETDISSSMNAMRTALHSVLSELETKLSGKFAELKSFEEATNTQKAKLKELYELEHSAGTLLAVLQAKEDVKRQAETEKIELDQKRKRDDEEYRFTFDLQKRKDKESYEAEKRKLETELEVKRAEFEEQQRAFALQEAEFSSLQKQVEEFPTRLEQEKQRLEAHLTTEASKEKETALLIARKEAEARTSILEGRIHALESTLEEYRRLIGSLQEQLKASQSQTQEVVLKSIEGASGAKTLDVVNKLALEQTRATSGRG